MMLHLRNCHFVLVRLRFSLEQRQPSQSLFNIIFLRFLPPLTQTKANERNLLLIKVRIKLFPNLNYYMHSWKIEIIHRKSGFQSKASLDVMFLCVSTICFCHRVLVIFVMCSMWLAYYIIITTI